MNQLYFNKKTYSACFRSTYTKVGTIQRRLAWPLCKDDMQICEIFHTFLFFKKIYKKKSIQSKKQTNKQKTSRELPWWRSGWEFTCQCRGYGFDPWSGKIPHVAEQVSLCSTTMEVSTLDPESHMYWSPSALEPVLPNKRSPHKATNTQRSQNKNVKNWKRKHLVP